LPKHPLKALAVLFAKIRDRLEVRPKLAHQPHQFHIPPTFPFKHPARSYPVQIPINIKLQQISRIIRRAARLFGRRLLKPQLFQLKSIHIDIDEPNCVILPDLLIKRLGKQNPLLAAFSFNVAHGSTSNLSAPSRFTLHQIIFLSHKILALFPSFRY